MRSSRPESGATLILVALCLFLLIGMAALVIDLGNGRQVRRQAQNAVDAGSLAAVVDYNGTPATEAAASARAIEYVDDNGFPPASNTIAVSFYTNALGEPCVSVRVSGHQVPTTFGRVLGWNMLLVGAEANACRSPGTTTIPGLFAGGTCAGPGKGFVISGNDNRMEGSIHSNFDAKESGNNNFRTAGTSATYVSNPLDISGSGLHWWSPGAVQTVAAPWPVTFNMADFQPGGSRALAAAPNYYSFTGDRSLSGAVNSGIYYTTGKWELTSITVTPFNGRTGATFVTPGGVLELKGDVNIRPFSGIPEKLTFFAGWQEPGKTGTLRCDSETMKVSGNCNRFDGIAYVPNGKYTASGEGNGHDRAGGSCGSSPSNTYTGGVLAWAVNINGNYNLYRGGTVPGGAGNPYLDT